MAGPGNEPSSPATDVPKPATSGQADSMVRRYDGFINNNRTVIRQLASIVLIYLAQRIFRSFLFACPCLPSTNSTLSAVTTATNYLPRNGYAVYSASPPSNLWSTSHVYRLVKSNEANPYLWTPEPHPIPASAPIVRNKLKLTRASELRDETSRSNSKFRRAYGLTFFLMPALCLFIIKLYISTEPWKLLTGCCRIPLSNKLYPSTIKRSNEVEAGTYEVGEEPRKAFRPKRKGPFCTLKPRQIVQIVTGSLVPASIWLIISLMDGRFLVCAYSTSPCDSQNYHSKEVSAKSQIIGWILVGALASLLAIMYLPVMCGKRNYYEKRFARIYEMREENEMESMARAKADKLANEEVSKYFEEKERGQGLNWWKSLVPSVHLKQLISQDDLESPSARPQPHQQTNKIPKVINDVNLEENKPFLIN